MNLFNYYAYGSIVEWMYRDMCGLNPFSGEDGAAGFRHALFAPKPDPSLQWAKARYRSAAGVYESGWRYDEGGALTIELTVPFNATARVTLPDMQDGITLDGEPVGANVKLMLDAGSYRIAYPTPEPVAVTG